MRVARFLVDRGPRTFDAADFQKAFGQGRETARRLLATLVEEGLLVGLKGAKGDRTTRYRLATSGQHDAGE